MQGCKKRRACTRTSPLFAALLMFEYTVRSLMFVFMKGVAASFNEDLIKPELKSGSRNFTNKSTVGIVGMVEYNISSDGGQM
jgi:membrane protein implicated in regulation of membrane protease activity